MGHLLLCTCGRHIWKEREKKKGAKSYLELVEVLEWVPLVYPMYKLIFGNGFEWGYVHYLHMWVVFKYWKVLD